MQAPDRPDPPPQVRGGVARTDTIVPTVVALYVAPGRRAPMRPVRSVVAEAGRGLVGDRYHGARHRHVTVQTQTDLDAAGADLGRRVEPWMTRRNVTVSHDAVPTRPGDRFTIGDVRLEVVRPSAPCRLLDDEGGPGTMRALHGRVGAVCRVLSSGTVHVGAAVDFSGGDVSAAGRGALTGD